MLAGLSFACQSLAQFQGLSNTVTTPDLDFGSGSVADIQGGDINGDGINDIVFLITNGYVGYVPGRADGRLDEVVQVWAADGDGKAFELLDYDGDGDLDVVRTAQMDGGEVRMLRNNGESGFVLDFAITGLGGLISRHGVVMGDVDDDGQRDLFILTTNGVRIVRKVAGGFSMSPVTATFPNFTGVAIDAADIDGDGRSDAAVLSSSLNEIILLRSNGTTLVEAGRLASDTGPADLKLVDMDDDGDADLVVAATGMSRIRVFTNNGGVLTFAYSIPSYSPREIEAVDIDADGDLDLAALTRHGPDYSNDDRVVIYLNDGMGFFSPYGVAYMMHFGDFDTLAVIDVVPSTGPDVVGAFHSTAGRVAMRMNQTPFTAPGEFVLQTPADGTTGVGLPAWVRAWGGRTRAALQWEHATGFNVKYEVRISGSESLANPVFVASNLTDRFVDVSAVDLEAGQTYYWGVTASNSAGTRVAGPFTFGTVGSCRADFNGEGGVTVQDLFDFLASWFAGCP